MPVDHRPPKALGWEKFVSSHRATRPCPGENTLGALVHRELASDQAVQVTAHLDECIVCQRAMIAMVRGGAAPSGQVTEPGASSSSGALFPTAPRRLGRYELRALLGKGGMGAVYRAHDTELDRAVALKVLRPELSAVTGLTDRLVQESRLMAKVAHPAVITIYDVGCDGDAVFIAMELVRGMTLTAWLASRQAPWRTVVAVFERAGEGLAAAHGAGIVHCDFKPDNVLVTCGLDKIVVTDLGIAREVVLSQAFQDRTTAATLEHPLAGTRVGAPLTTDGAAIGTPGYMAPEQIERAKVDRRADVFAFSVSLWEGLFGVRPFLGASMPQIYGAMLQGPPRPPAGSRRVPRRLVRVLRRGLAIHPGDRWRDMHAMLSALAAVRARRRRTWLVAGATCLLGAAVAAALVMSPGQPPVNRCARAAAALDQAYPPSAADAIRAALAHAPQIRDRVIATLDATAAAWRATHGATCHADRDPLQDPAITACLDARRLELASAVDDLRTDGAAAARHAVRRSALPADPAACADPRSGAWFARVPADRALRRQVTALRAQLYDAEDARDRCEYPRALAAAEPVVAAAAVWPPLAAEALLSVGTTQRRGGDTRLAPVTLRAAAAAAEAAHHDDVAARSWGELALATSADHDATRALEYVALGEAAADRIARPASVMAPLTYVKGIALVTADRTAEAETVLREAVALARTTTAGDLAWALQGLGTLYDRAGNYGDAVAALRQAIEQLPRTPSGQIIGPPGVFERLAQALVLIGRRDDAEIEARRAVEIADRTLPETQLDRPCAHAALAQTLDAGGRKAEALAEAAAAVQGLAQIVGARGERYAEALAIQGDILGDLERFAEAEPLLARACEILAFTVGEAAAEHATCEVRHAMALAGLHRETEALVVLDRAIAAILRRDHTTAREQADAFRLRGTVHAAAHHHREAIADFERAIAGFSSAQLEPGYLASAKWQLGRELGADDPRRARAEITEAIQLYDRTTGWQTDRKAAAAWLASHPR